MTRAKPNTRNSEFHTQVLKGELFRLASIDLLGVSLSEGKRFAFAQVYFYAKCLGFHLTISHLIRIRKRPTAEMTWGETASVNVKGNGRRDNKAAVSPSRPLICSA